MGPHYLDRLFAPRAIAVLGASEETDAVGTVVFRNLLQAGYPGKVFAINPRHQQVQGQVCYPDIEHIARDAGPVDLAVIATPAPTVPDIIRRCGEAGVRAAVILSAGFAGSGDGQVLQKQLLEQARQYGMRIVGPNCLGILRPPSHPNTTFSNTSALPGEMAR